MHRFAAILIAALTVMPLRADEDVEHYLARHGLERMVATHLEEQLATAQGDARISIAERLGQLYMTLFDRAATPEDRDYWELRSRKLLEAVPEADTASLRINLLKARYLRAERIAELDRLKAASDEQLDEARAAMSELATALAETHRTIEARIQRLDRLQLEHETNTMQSRELNRNIEDLVALSSQAAYYAAWARYHNARFTGVALGIDEALLLFGRILQSPRGEHPALDELPVSLLTFDHVARAAIGVALCHAQNGHGYTALDWLDAVEAAEIPDPVRQAIPAYRLEILFGLDAPDVPAIEAEIQRLERAGEMTTTMWRLVAVHALQASRRPGAPAAVLQHATDAMVRLAETGHMDQVLAITERFDLGALGGGGVVEYLQALQAHERARDAHGSQDPTTDSAVVELYAQAERRLESASRQAEVAAIPGALAQIERLLAWSRYYRGDFSAAAERFERLARSEDRRQAEEAAWMRIVCLDRLQERSAQQREPFVAAMSEFLDRFPSSAKAGSIKLRLAAATADADLEQVEMLLSIPPQSEAYRAARLEAERLLYGLVREASGMRRVELADRYVDLASSLNLEGHRALMADRLDDEQRQRHLDASRRLLDVLLMRGVARLRDAEQVLERLDAAAGIGAIDLDAVRDELAYRRFQIDLLAGRDDPAHAWVQQHWDAGDRSQFVKAATTELFRLAAEDWRAFPDASWTTDTLRRLVEHGRRLIDWPGSPADVNDPASLALIATQAEALTALANRTGDSTLRREAADWFGRLLTVHPSEPRFLKGDARLAETQGDKQRALDRWRAIQAAIPEGQPEWFEAKFNVVRLLFELAPALAADVLAQHETLYPDFGPSPWGERLRALKSSQGGPTPTDRAEGDEP